MRLSPGLDLRKYLRSSTGVAKNMCSKERRGFVSEFNDRIVPIVQKNPSTIRVRATVQSPERCKSVFMIMNGTVRDGLPEVAPFVRSQSEALQKAGLKVHLGVVDNRTSPHGILRNIHRLRREIAY